VKKGFFIYYRTNGIFFLKKLVNAYHSFIAQMFEEEVNSLLKSIKERLAQKILGIVGFQIEIQRIIFLEFLVILGDVVCKQKNWRS
jgi:Zn-dependent M16 (insulinase) family peptidase